MHIWSFWDWIRIRIQNCFLISTSYNFFTLFVITDLHSVNFLIISFSVNNTRINLLSLLIFFFHIFIIATVNTFRLLLFRFFFIPYKWIGFLVPILFIYFFNTRFPLFFHFKFTPGAFWVGGQTTLISILFLLFIWFIWNIVVWLEINVHCTVTACLPLTGVFTTRWSRLFVHILRFRPSSWFIVLFLFVTWIKFIFPEFKPG